MPQFDTSFFVPEVIWTLLSFIVLFLLLKKLVLPRLTRMLEARSQLIENEINAARQQHEEAEKLHREYEQKLQDVEREANQLFLEADRRILEHREQLMREWQKEMEQRKRQFHEDAEAAKQQALREIRNQTAAMVIEATEKSIHRQLDSEAAEQMVDEAIETIGQSLKKQPPN
ncbi:MAG TPA: F0F1 ATP synthase subunit B [Mariprofundaceae bacterium]|nr:F0F1 ATP synthase subunit B [Mariprofundaceae bacterium]